MLQRLCRQWSKKKLPQLNGCLYLPALQHPVTVHRDKWGIPHIQAKNRQDLFLAQGFVQAQDRFWQMELNRRAATGTLSELFGPLTLATDRLTRTLGFGRLAKPAWRYLDAKTRADLTAYVQGINAWLNSKPQMPLEFTLLRHRPQPWQIEDSLAYGRLQMWALTHGALGELVQAQLNQKLGESRAADLAVQYPDDNPTTLPQGIEIGDIKLDGLLGSWTHPFMGKGPLDGLSRGSNAWVVSADRSASGHALLCNDMHLPVGTPSLWYTMHLHSSDGFHVTGFTQPGLPYVLVGHNEHIAWGATLAYTDCEDLFWERFHPQHPTFYEFQGNWKQAAVFEEKIAVRRRKTPHIEQVLVTHHGPLINDVLTDNQAPVALCSVALQPEVTIDGFRRLNEAHDWTSFVTAVSRIQSPPLNLLYADRQDNIGHYVSGLVPIRQNSDGTLPVPGWTGEYEWDESVPFAEMPHALNPAGGLIVSANHRLITDNYPHFLGKMWRNGYRAQRIETLLQQTKPVSLAHCQKIQMDVYNIPGVILSNLLIEIMPDTSIFARYPQGRQALLAYTLLKEWDGQLTPDSIGGSALEILIRRLSTAILSPYLERPFLLQVLGLGHDPLLHPVNEFQGQWLVSLLRLLQVPTSPWLPDKEATLVHCLAETATELQQRLGPDSRTWEWGRLHKITFAHALGTAPLAAIFNQGPFPIGGDANTVAQTGIRPDLPYDNNGISISSRFIIDMGHMDEAQGMHAPGQSGHLGSPHYGDLIQPWLAGNYYPFTWTPTAVRAASRHTLTLAPQIGT